MIIIDSHGLFKDAIAASSPRAKRLAHRLRDLIVEIYPDVTEVAWTRQQVIGYGVGPKKMSEHFAYIGAYADHVNLGFNYGADLPDPEGLLEGTGKKFRHIKVHSDERLRMPALRHLIDAAIAEREQALGKGR